MNGTRIQTGSVEPIEIFAVTTAGAPATGLSTLVVRVRRNSDGFYLDWADDTFKSTGWTTINGALTEVDATNAPGLYSRSFDTSAITNKATDDIYTIIPDKTSGTTRLPAPAQLYEGDYVDDLDAAISSRGTADPGDAMALTAAAIDAVWDEPLAGHLTAGSTGKALDDAATAGGITAQEVRDAMKLAPTAGAPAAGSVDEHLDDILTDTAAMQPTIATNLDATVSSRGTADPGDAMALTAAAVDAIWDEPIAGHLTAGSTGKALDDAKDAADAASIADAVWDEAMAGHTGAGSTGERLNRLDATISSRAAAGDAMDLVAGAVDSGSLDTTAVAEIADGVWDEAMAGHVSAGTAGQQQNRLDATITSRAAPGDAMDLAANALDASAVATSGANEIRDSILSDSTPFAGANIDAAISSRGTADAGDAMTLTGGERAAVTDAVWDEPIAGHLTAGSTGKALDDADAVADAAAIADAVWDEASAGHTTAGTMGLLQSRLDTPVSTRAAPGDNMDLVSNAVDAAALATDAVAEIVDGVWDEALAGHVTAGSAGKKLTDTAEAGDAMDLVTDAVDAAALATSAVNEIADQVWEEAIADHSGTAGSTAEALDNVAAPATPATIAAAVWDEAMAGHTTAGTAGEQQNRLDATVSSRAAPGAAMDLVGNAVDAAALATDAVNEIRDSILSDSTPFAGANIDAAITSRGAQTDVTAILADTAAMDARLPSDPADESLQQAAHTATQAAIAALNDPTAAAIADAVWDEALAGHLTAGSTGKALDDADAVADASAIADAVWDEDLSGHATAGSAGEALTNADAGATAAQKIDSVATLDPSSAATGSLLDRLANKDGSKTYDQSTDSLEATRDRIG